MGRKTNLLPSIFRNRELQSSWEWRLSCSQTKTLSFRSPAAVSLDTSDGVTTPESLFTETSGSTSFLTDHSEEMIIREVMRSSDRLFFEPGECTSSSIMEDPREKMVNGESEEENPFKESVVVVMDTEDPYRDFKRSMQEMIESYGGVHDWEWLQELLGWYLKMNGDGSHGFIVRAFVDLLIELSSTSTKSSYSLCTSYSSAVSCLSPPPSTFSSLGLKEV
ncbi:unnamed protein product [Cuscuta epithymum]|uniref:Transcription repressor n=1 Tax=Cuscuta epithymum TaxID=186058 RepID=A0AAV0D969_9ASTE|nr:unnamed protein product [Cuscuta epithymum]CAH9148791.1 unnamed protein product [Cuscuta epithymum]